MSGHATLAAATSLATGASTLCRARLTATRSSRWSLTAAGLEVGCWEPEPQPRRRDQDAAQQEQQRSGAQGPAGGRWGCVEAAARTPRRRAGRPRTRAPRSAGSPAASPGAP